MECFVGNAYSSYKLYIFKYTLAFRLVQHCINLRVICNAVLVSSTSPTRVSSPTSDSISGIPESLGSR